MKINRSIPRVPSLLAVSGGLLPFLVGLSLSGAAESTRYRVIPIEDLPGAKICPCFSAEAINDHGMLAGNLFAPNDERHGFFFDGRSVIDIGLLGIGGEVTQISEMNNLGQIVGYSSDANIRQHGFIYHEGVMTDIGTLGGEFSLAADINDAGIVVGFASSREYTERPVIMIDGRMRDLGTFGGEFGQALAINELNEIVGWTWNTSRQCRPFHWTEDEGMTDLGILGGLFGSAQDVNDHGDIVGESDIDEQLYGQALNRAVLWRGGQIIDLGVLPNAGKPGLFGPELVNTAAIAINNQGQIIGNSWPAVDHFGAWIRNADDDGAMTSLTERLTRDSAGWGITQAHDINDAGWIVGVGRFNGGNYEAVLLVPVIERAPHVGDHPTESDPLSVQRLK